MLVFLKCDFLLYFLRILLCFLSLFVAAILYASHTYICMWLSPKGTTEMETNNNSESEKEH